MRKIIDWIIARAKRTPYFHLYHGDGSLYMERYWLVPFAEPGSDSKEGCFRAAWREQPFTWLMQRLGIAVRVHCIHTADLDRHMHDHPWTFVSVVLRGFYIEARPLHDGPPQFDVSGREPAIVTVRGTSWNPIARRTVWDRHRITSVSHGGVWTLFITGPKRQSWGFFTERGWIGWRDYESVHNKAPIKAAA